MKTKNVVIGDKPHIVLSFPKQKPGDLVKVSVTIEYPNGVISGSDCIYKFLAVESNPEKAVYIAGLQQLILIVNPKEKITEFRLRMYRARVKEYTPEEIKDSAKAFSHSIWHKENHQMSIDNLLAPSKFGHWYAERNQKPEFDEESTDDFSPAERKAKILERME